MTQIFYNGNIYTGSGNFAEAFAVEDGHFTFVGSNRDALALTGEKMDLQEKFVCAGFNDSHMHLLNLGNALCIAPLAQHTGSLADMLRCLEDFLPNCGTGWLVGRGWNQDQFTDERRMPTRYDLDKVSTQIPICVVRACGHALCVNSKALEILNIPENPAQPDGGQIVLEDGKPNGIFLDSAMGTVYDAIPAPDREQLKQRLLAGCQALNRYGVTSCQSDDYGTFSAVSWQTINEIYRELEEEGLLSVRVNQQANFSNADALREFIAQGNITGKGSEFYRIGPLKLLGDGALGARTAFLSRPYADAPETCGIPVFSQETFDEMISLAHEAGMQVAVHAIGDACLDRVLASLRKALAAHPRTDHRHGIVHCQITRPDQLDEMIRMDLHIYAQSIFLDYDTKIVHDRVGPELAQSSYNWKTLLDAGICVSNGTDSPVEAPDALAGIQCAVTRTPLAGGQPYLPEQAFSVAQALDSYTANSARASFEENQKGQIAKGMLADFVILEQDPFHVQPDQLSQIQIHSTWLGGKQVYTR